ncbi:hypothetical protein EAS61_00995 [Bradyrhizobium zhanjiangense]|uniref:Uncharacterized protein n=1 Tax=Bradyrhizobium zhanjiangense TaxID=1325107 RepID=A0A4Q0QZM9_9BRAD|nr:hypothetical protein EAS61_00995 [Bradyrhizobium zhanjiangense]
MPPEVEVPLPLGFDRVAVPVVDGSARGVAELAAGSPVTAPRPLGAPPCAKADPASNTTTIAANPVFICALPVLCGLTAGLLLRSARSGPRGTDQCGPPRPNSLELAWNQADRSRLVQPG